MFWAYQSNGPLVGLDARQSISTGADGKRVNVVSYTIAWGDGEIDSKGTTDFQHSYQSFPGTFNITLTIRDANGFSSSTSTQLTLDSPSIPVPTLDVTPVTGSPSSMNFRALWTTGMPQIATILYDFGDGTPPVEYYEWRSKQASPTPDFTHQYSKPGTYAAKVTLTSDKGVTSVGTKSVVVGGNGS